MTKEDFKRIKDLADSISITSSKKQAEPLINKLSMIVLSMDLEPYYQTKAGDVIDWAKKSSGNGRNKDMAIIQLKASLSILKSAVAK